MGVICGDLCAYICTKIFNCNSYYSNLISWLVGIFWPVAAPVAITLIVSTKIGIFISGKIKDLIKKYGGIE